MREICEKLVYKHSEKTELAYFLRNLQTLRANNSRILSEKRSFPILWVLACSKSTMGTPEPVQS